VNIGEDRLARRRPDLTLKEVDVTALQKIHSLLQSKNYLLEYHL